MVKCTAQTRRRPFSVWLLVGSIVAAGLLYGLSWRYPGELPDGDAEPYIVHHLILLVILGSALMAGRGTGASLIALSPEDAQTIGFDIGKLHYGLRIQTANGIA